MLLHAEFNFKDVQSTKIMQLLWKLELPCKECAALNFNAIISMLRVVTNQATVFFQFPAGLSGIALQELSMERTSHIEKFSPVCCRHC